MNSAAKASICEGARNRQLCPTPAWAMALRLVDPAPNATVNTASINAGYTSAADQGATSVLSSTSLTRNAGAPATTR